MPLLTNAQRARLLANGRTNATLTAAGRRARDFRPVVKLFTPDAGATWLLTELDPANPNSAFGLCDLGLGCPEFGRVSLTALAALRGRLGLPIERDRHFAPDKLLTAYAAAAYARGTIAA